MKIDFVVTWVDGEDPYIIDKKHNYFGDAIKKDDQTVRYRKWDHFKYFFRGVEENANWVNRIYLVVDNQLPKWLNITNPKLVIVNHEDFIPRKYLPTFNSRTIELNLHRIDSLSEHFVLFNDDMFIINKTKEDDFFYKEKPLATMGLNADVGSYSSSFSDTNIKNTQLINDHFNKNIVLKSNIRNWFNLTNPRIAIKTALLSPGVSFSGFHETHYPYSFIKTSFSEAWEKVDKGLEITSNNRLREHNDVNIWFIKYWQMCKGITKYRDVNIGYYVTVSKDNLKEIEAVILNSNKKFVCLNDNENLKDIELLKEQIILFLDKKLPNKSSFEI